MSGGRRRVVADSCDRASQGGRRQQDVWRRSLQRLYIMNDTRVVCSGLHSSSPPINLEVMVPQAEAEAEAQGAAGNRRRHQSSSCFAGALIVH